MEQVMTVKGIVSNSQYLLRDATSGRSKVVVSDGNYRIGDTVVVINGVIVRRTKSKAHRIYNV